MNIYAGNLLRNLSEDELRQVFESYGTVTTTAIIKDKISGESRGFGFVEMPNADEAQKAITGMNGRDFKGRAMTVNEAKPRTDAPRTKRF
jgi:RNA recognition motif-containing protein